MSQDMEREALECAGWNFEATDTEVLVCRNNHDKGAACDMRPMHPAEVLKLINRLRARVLELEHRAALASQPPAVQGEPYAHIVELPAGEYAGTVKFFTAPSDPRGRPVYLHQASTPSREPLTEPELRHVLDGTNNLVRNAMRGPFWPELEEACRAIERAHGIHSREGESK